MKKAIAKKEPLVSELRWKYLKDVTKQMARREDAREDGVLTFLQLMNELENKFQSRERC